MGLRSKYLGWRFSIEKLVVQAPGVLGGGLEGRGRAMLSWPTRNQPRGEKAEKSC